MPNDLRAQNPFPGTATLDGYQQISGTCSEGDMVRLRTGNLIRLVSIADIPTVSFPLQFFLVYNAQSMVYGAVGHRWQHNLMMRLDLSTPGLVSFLSSQGRQFDFVYGASGWELDAGSYYFAGRLAQVGATWRMAFPSGNFYEFDSTGLLQRLVDRHGKATTLNDSATGLVVTEPEGRSLVLQYITGSNLLGSVTDPLGRVTQLTYDGSDNLTNVITYGPDPDEPGGCLVYFGYATPSNHLITSRTDGKGHTHSYTYIDETGATYNDPTGATPALLSGVTSPESDTIHYSYGSATERTGDAEQRSFAQTTLTDARSLVWRYRFDTAGNLWRIIDPIGHQRRFYWSPEQALLSASGGFANVAPEPLGPRDNHNNSYWRTVRDEFGNILLSAEATGLVTQYEYDEHNRPLRVHPGRAHLAVQGNWRDHFGDEGFLLCSFLSENQDVTSLPDDVQSVSLVGDRKHLEPSVGVNNNWRKLMDPRIPDDGSSSRREGGFWHKVGQPGQVAEVQVSISLKGPASFNLSVYSNSADIGQMMGTTKAFRPLAYQEQFGRDLEFSVEDLGGESERQTVRIPNNAPGVWVTFPVRGDAENPIVLKVTAHQPPGASSSNVVEAIMSALAFDSYENRSFRFEYNSAGDLTQMTDPLGSATVMTYDGDGRLSTVTTTVDAQARTTSFCYEDLDLDGFKETTRIVDALNGETVLTRDLVGNMVAWRDANLHTTTFSYDLKNRLTKVTDALAQVTQLEHDPAGNLWKVTDAKGRVTELLYTGSNRLRKVRRPLGDPLQGETVLAYDASGNLVSFQGPKGHLTRFEFDGANRPVAGVHADEARDEYAYDALDRLVAFTPPNGNQAPSLMNSLGAVNLLQNPSAEEGDPNNPALARYWSTTSPAGSRDSSTVPPPGGTYSLRMSKTANFQDWNQELADLHPGLPLLVRFWGLTNNAQAAGMAEGGAIFPPANNSPGFQVSPTDADPAAYYQTSWAQLPKMRSPGVPGDAQVTQAHGGRAHFGYKPGIGGNQILHIDLGEVHGLGTALRYDRQGRLSLVWRPDNSTVQYQRDRFGRLRRLVDPKGGLTLLNYDALDRLVEVLDPEGNRTGLIYDEVGRLTSVTDGRGSQTLYTYDALDRLLGLVYPDSTSEALTYDAMGNLKTYKDNATATPSVLCEFFYDEVNRLTRIHYPADSTDVQFTYDEVGNVTSRTERNGDREFFRRDALDRVTGTSRIPGTGFATPGWGYVSTYDANDNRLSLNRKDYGARYGGSRFQPSAPPDPTAAYSSPQAVWSIPEVGGLDSRNRMCRFQDQDGHETRFEYDVDGRRTRIVYPFPEGSPLETVATYDALGRLTRLQTVQGATTRLDLQYGYDPSSNRVSQATLTDTFEYGLDRSDRLVEECINRATLRRPEAFARGEVEAAEVEAGEAAVKMLALDDDFSGDQIHVDRWRLAFSGGDLRGMEVRQSGALEMTFPRGCSNYLYGGNPTWVDTLSLSDFEAWAGAEHRVRLSGDFSVQVDFQSYQAWSAVSVRLGLRVQDQPLETPSENVLLMALEHTPGQGHVYRGQVTSGGTLVQDGSATNPDASGKLRIRRAGSTVHLERWDPVGQAFVTVVNDTAFTTGDLYVSLVHSNERGVATVRFQNFHRSDGPYPLSATYTSPVFDAGRTPAAWNTISWTPTVPAGTSLQFNVALKDSPDGPWEDSDFEGPFTTPSGSALPGSLSGRYMRLRACFSGMGASTPEFSRVDVTFAGALAPSLRVYDFDASGNMTRKTVETETPTGVATVTEVRDDSSWPAADRLNDLNQFRRIDVTDASGTMTWRYDWDANGNLVKKYVVDGTPVSPEVWDYAWSDDNRLVQVTQTLSGGPDPELQIAYGYDSVGRMLTRTVLWENGSEVSSPVPATFEWDGWDLVREVDPEGVETVYYAPEGEILGFRRGTETYQVHADALGSVRRVTDSSGSSVANLIFEAWGVPLSGSGALVGELGSRFVGALGTRADMDTGFTYMRNRWYDPQLAQFVSRDPAKSRSSYLYTDGNPVSRIDPMGLQWGTVGNDSEGNTWAIYADGTRTLIRTAAENGPQGPPRLGQDPKKNLIAWYKWCYTRILSKWGLPQTNTHPSVPYRPMSGWLEDLTYLLHPGAGGCGDWQDDLSQCMAQMPASAQAGWAVTNVDVYTGWSFAPWMQHHAVMIVPKADPSPGSSVVLDPWITGKPDVYSFNLWWIRAGATGYWSKPFVPWPGTQWNDFHQ